MVERLLRIEVKSGQGVGGTAIRTSESYVHLVQPRTTAISTEDCGSGIVHTMTFSLAVNKA